MIAQLKKVTKWVILFPLPFLISWQLESFTSQKPAKAYVLTQADDFLVETRHLLSKADDFKFAKISIEDLQKQLIRTREAYKSIEFITLFYFPSFTSEHINGAPLLHIQRHDSRPYVIPPEGLQVLDEMIFSEHAKDEAAQIMILCQKLHTQTALLVKGLKNKAFHEHELIAASQLSIISILSLGITGFDTPGSVNALAEAKVSLQSLQQVNRIGSPQLKEQQMQRLDQLFEGGITFLSKHNDFDAFDRLAFFKTYLNPIYQMLATYSQASEELAKSQITTSVRLEAANIFDKNFLNPYFFTELSQQEDSDQLKELGKKLFYDPILSSDGKMSCASCHDPQQAFTDGLPRSSSNVQGKQVSRNAPSLLNSVYADRYFYDLRAFTLEQQTEHVIFNQDEFNTAYEEILFKLQADDDYVDFFTKISGKVEPDQHTFSSALASYVLSLQSHNSPFDKYMRNESADISDEVKQGFNLFMGKAACGTCHFAPTFSGLVPPFFVHNESEILGVPNTPFIFNRKLDKDMGRYDNGIFNEQAWIFERSFKTPTVRNAAVSAPYFHNGMYPNLDLVLDFYNQGGGAGMGLSVKNQTLPENPLNLSDSEKKAIIAFMESLTDTTSYSLYVKK